MGWYFLGCCSWFLCWLFTAAIKGFKLGPDNRKISLLGILALAALFIGGAVLFAIGLGFR